MQTLEIRDFGGGIVDNVIGANPGRMANLVNVELYPSDDGLKLRSRDGFVAVAYRLQTGDQTIGRIFSYGASRAGIPLIFAQTSRKLYVFDDGVTDYATECYAQTSGSTDPAFSSAFDTTTSVSVCTDAHHIYLTLEIYSYNRSYYREHYAIHRVASGDNIFVTTPHTLPKPTITINTSSGAGNNWIYKMVYVYAYSIPSLYGTDITTFYVYSPASSALAAPTDESSVTINIPAAPTGFKTTAYTSISYELYRTTSNGGVYYKCAGPTALSTSTTYTDTMSDATLVTQSLLYTESEMDNTGIASGHSGNATIRAKTIFNNICYGISGGDTVHQSKIDAPRQFGDTAYTYIGDYVVGIGATPNAPVVLCENFAFRIDGQVSDSGDGGMHGVKIGAISPPLHQNSIVESDTGIFWLASNGIWFSDGNSVEHLTRDCETYVNQDYLTMAQNYVHFVHGVFDAVDKRVYWVIPKNSVDNAVILVYDLMYSANGVTNLYRWYRNQRTETSICKPWKDKRVVISDSRGYLYYSSGGSAYYTPYEADARYETTSGSSSWSWQTIMYEVKTAEYSFGDLYTRKYIPIIGVTIDATLTLDALYNQCTAITHLHDNRTTGSLKAILLSALKTSINVFKRHIPAGKLRCYTKGLKLSNAYVALYNSSYYSTCSINATSKTATLTNTTDYDWPTSILDHKISFETDGYVNEYSITARSNDTVTYSDAGNTSVTGSGKKWIIRGYPRFQRLKLLSLSFNYDINGQTADPYNTADSAEL